MELIGFLLYCLFLWTIWWLENNLVDLMLILNNKEQ